MLGSTNNPELHQDLAPQTLEAPCTTLEPNEYFNVRFSYTLSYLIFLLFCYLGPNCILYFCFCIFLFLYQHSKRVILALTVSFFLLSYTIFFSSITTSLSLFFFFVCVCVFYHFFVCGCPPFTSRGCITLVLGYNLYYIIPGYLIVF